MAQIAPFRGVRYVVPSLRECLAPPYDVIAPPEREQLRQFPHNITHLTLPDRYDAAARLWQDWQRQDVLRADVHPSVYLLEQQFMHPITGEGHRRLAMVCLLKLEEYEAGIVLPHENTQALAKEDRLHLLRATQANLEPVYGLVEGGLSAVLEGLKTEASSVSEVEYVDGRHRLYCVEDALAIRAVVEAAAPSRVWIADGHHRYETALQYRRERRAAEGDPSDLQPYDWIMMALTPLEDPGIVILPTHRVLLEASPDALALLPTYLKSWFDLVPCPAQEAASRLREGTSPRGFAVVMREGQAFLAWLKAGIAVQRLVPGEHSATYRQLDVTLLQSLVLEPLFGMTAHRLERAEGIRYTRDEREAVQWVLRGEAAVAFLLQPPSVQEVRQVALSGEKMPPKSTYFYPKLLSGLVMRALSP